MPILREWFREQTVLITGGTGFLGQALIYKLVQIGCQRIFLLIRPKRDKNAEQRLDEMVKTYTFDTLREKFDIRSKLTAVSCDNSITGLGISDDVRTILNEKVTVVIHGAASVKFDDPLKIATLTNLKMTRDVFELALGMRNLQVVTYVSTAYSNSEYITHGVEEKLYETKMDWRRMIEAAETMPDEILNSLEQKLIGASPNTYNFTKHLAESLVNDYGKQLQAVIIRPQIVFPAIKEPDLGWINNLSSPVAIMGGSGKGVIRLYYGDPRPIKAYVPIDVVVNGTLAATWHRATQQSKELVPIYNTTYMGVPANMLRKLCYELCETHPLKDALWYRHFHCVVNRHTFLFLHLLVHVLPGLALDGLLKLTGNKTRMVRIYRKAYMAYVTLAPYLNISDFFHTKKFEELCENLPEDEKDVFYVDMHFPEGFLLYLQNATSGFRAFLGEPRQAQPKDFTHVKRLYYLDLAAKYLFYLAIIWLIPYATIFDYVTGFFMNLVSLFDLSDL